jgi:excisionase family DNA binding protein
MPINSQSYVALLTVEETAELLRVSQRGVRRMLDKKLVPAIRVMGSIRIDVKDILSYVEKQKTRSSLHNENDLAKKYELT